jgi:signal transduction histidine kinase
MALKRSVIVTGQRVQRELRLHTARGWRHFIYHLEPVRDAAGEVSGIRSAVMDITEQRVLEQEVGEHLTRVEVQRRLIEQREQERLQVARDLHDGPIQELLGVNYSLQTLLGTLQRRPEAEEVQRIQAAVLSQVNDLRAFASELRPPLLAKFGLGKAIQAHAAALQGKLPELRLHLQVDEENPPLPEPVCLPLYRIFQEAANNILKHSQAKDVWVRFKVMERLVVLEVRDNGVGFDLPGQWLDLARQGHLGLVGMQERAEAVGGIVNIISRLNQGTTVQVSVPLFNGEARPMGETS